jgi:hypothetical protein
MKTKTYYLCDGCSAEIRGATQGFILQGTIRSVEGGGLFGRNEPEDAPFKDIWQEAICKKCFKKAVFGEDEIQIAYRSGSLGGPG